MTTENSMPQAPAATLTEKELWGLFINATMQRTMSMGPTVEIYRPGEMLRDPGQWGDMDDFTNSLADEVAESEDPEDALQARLSELVGYVENVKSVLEAFHRVKNELVIYNEDSDEPSRYRMPMIGGAKEAA